MFVVITILCILTLVAGVGLMIYGADDRNEGMQWSGFVCLIMFGIEMIGMFNLAGLK